MKQRLSKIKKKDGRIEIHAEQSLGGVEGDDGKSTVLRCSDEPQPSFYEAMQALTPHVRAICELLPKQWGERVTVTGVSFSMSKDGDEGVVITSLVQLSTSDAPLVLNTPHKMVSDLTEAARKALAKVQQEADAYFNGKRAQGSMFADAEDVDEAA